MRGVIHSLECNLQCYMRDVSVMFVIGVENLAQIIHKVFLTCFANKIL